MDKAVALAKGSIPNETQGEDDWGVKIPTVGGYWLVSRVDYAYIVNFEAVMSVNGLYTIQGTFDNLSEVYEFLATKEIENES